MGFLKEKKKKEIRNPVESERQISIQQEFPAGSRHKAAERESKLNEFLTKR